MWLGVWGPVPPGHSSEWEMFSLWWWERSWQCLVLSLKIVTWATLSSWWMLSSSVPMSWPCHHSVLKLFLGWPFLCCRTWGVLIAPTCFPILTAGLPPCLQNHSEKESTGESQMFCCYALSNKRHVDSKKKKFLFLHSGHAIVFVHLISVTSA